MTLTFKKIKYSDIPESLSSRIMEFRDGEIDIDETGMSRAELKRLTDWLEQEGYKEQP